jgi:hypothetical protein
MALTDRQADRHGVREPRAKATVEGEDCQSLSSAKAWWSAWRLDESLGPLAPQDPVHVYYQRRKLNAQIHYSFDLGNAVGFEGSSTEVIEW